jgi:hypothetical protein
MPKIIHETDNGFKFHRKSSNFIFILKCPDEEQSKDLLEKRFLYGIKIRNSDGSEEEIVDLHSHKTDDVKAFLKDTSNIVEYFVFADKKIYSDFLREKASEMRRVENMSEEAVEAQRHRHQIAHMSEKAVEAQRHRHQIAHMSDDAIEAHRRQNQIAHMSDDAIEAHRRQNQIAHMSDDAIEAHRRRNQTAHMSEDAIGAQRHRHQIASMDQEEVQAQRQRHHVAFMDLPTVVAERERDRNRERRKPKVSLQQIWDYDNPCEFCHCLFLKSEPKSFRKYCCQNGDYFLHDSEYPRLTQMPHFLVMELVHRCGLALKNIETGEIFTSENANGQNVLGRKSNKYNNMLALGNFLINFFFFKFSKIEN